MSGLDDSSPDTSSRRKSPAKVNPSTEQTAALDALRNKLARWEESNEVYREMCRAVDDRVTGRVS